jgi:CheY-like chemotaxis protein
MLLENFILVDMNIWIIAGGVSINSLRILLAEDDGSHQKLFLLMLARLDHKSDVVSNGYEAIRAVSQCKYDLVFMDVVMPQMDGLQATREIRKLDQKGLKIVAIAACVFPGVMEMCLDAGIDDCIATPVRIEDLKNALRNITEA